MKEQIKHWRSINKDRLSEYNKDYNEKNKDRISKYQKDYRESNKEIIREKRKEYFIEYRKLNAEKIKERRKEKSKIYNKKRRESINKKRSEDPILDLRYKISKLICISLKNQGYSKKSKTYNILGCTYEEFKNHIEKKFTEGMTWKNHGDWHLDHVIPVSSAKSEEDMIRLNHYSNFQPLWSYDNIKKGNKMNYEI